VGTAFNPENWGSAGLPYPKAMLQQTPSRDHRIGKMKVLANGVGGSDMQHGSSTQSNRQNPASSYTS
jgi:hypothetical protein